MEKSDRDVVVKRDTGGDPDVWGKSDKDAVRGGQ